MKGYWVNDSLMFIGKSVTYGWQKTLDHYKKGYPDTAAMGKLTFNLLKFKPLSPGLLFCYWQMAFAKINWRCWWIFYFTYLKR